MDDGVVVGLDLGTTSAKATAFDASGHARGAGEVGVELRRPQPGHAVLDPDEVVAAALAAVREAVRAAGGRVAGLSLSSALHSLVALGADERPITPVLTWADTRATDEAEALRRERPELHDRTGTPLHAMSPLAKLRWFAAHEPDVLVRAHRWVGVKELVVHRLCGRWVMDHSVASATGLVASATLDWDPEALALAGVGPERLPELAPGTEVLALTSDALGVDVPVVLGAGDGPLANLGVGAVHPGVAAVSIGTSGALRLMAEEPRVDPHRRVFCYALTPGRWTIGGAINNGGLVLDWLGEALAPDLGAQPAEALLALAADVPAGSDGLLMLPYLLSERAPRWSAVPRGAYVGLTRAHGRGHLVRAAVEGVCLQLALVLASLREAGEEVREVRATGGFARSALWRQLLCDALGMPLGFPASHQGSGFGAALLGMEALGIVDSFEVAAAQLPIASRLEPDPAAAARYADLLPVFAELDGALEPAFRRLRALG